MADDDGLGLGRAHPARMYDYYLGGKDHYDADRQAAEAVEQAFPAVPLVARLNRAFMRQAVRRLAGEVGIRQFLDIGTGIPTEPNLHQVAQAVAPECRVVNADLDPVVLAHAQALLTSTPEGRTAFIHADVTEPDTILNAPELRETLDLSRPVALSLIALLHFIPDERGAYAIVDRLLSALPSGSALVITHLTGDVTPEPIRRAVEIYRANGISLLMRSKAEVGRFFTGLRLLESGIELLHHWHPGLDDLPDGVSPAEVAEAGSGGWAAVGLKP